MTSPKNKAQETKAAAKSEFPDTPLDKITPCDKKPYFKKGNREDYVLRTFEAAKKKCLELAGIVPEHPRPGERNEPVLLDGVVIGYKAVDIESGKTVAEVHFHPADLKGHPPQTDPSKRDYISEMPHVNYANWRAGKKAGKKGHAVFQDGPQ